MRTIPLLRYTVVSHPAFTFNTQAEWLAGMNNLLEYTPNAILVRNTDPAAAGFNLTVQGATIKPNTELEFKCDDAGGVWNINEFRIDFPDSVETPFEIMMVSHTDFYYQEVEIRE